MTLVAEKDMCLIPGDGAVGGIGRKQSIKPLRGGTTGQRQSKQAARGYAGLGDLHQLVRARFRQRICIRENFRSWLAHQESLLSCPGARKREKVTGESSTYFRFA
jgi:hypothetical protein